MKELSRTPFDKGTYLITNCLVCGKEIKLYSNGGELDQERCCGHVYALESPQTDFMVYKANEE